MTPQNIPAELIGDIWNYLNPDRLNKLANCSNYINIGTRYIINSHMARKKYIEKWLDSDHARYTYVAHCHILEYELNNYWYYNLKFDYDTYCILIDIINKIKNKHLSINISLAFRRFINIRALDNVHSIRIYNAIIIDMGSLDNVYSLKLIQTKIIDSDIKYLGNVHTLSVGYDINLNLDTINCLTNVYILNISIGYDNILDVSALVNIHSLYIYSAYGVKIINNSLCTLCNIHTLSLLYCCNITDIDVALLANIHTLKLTGAKYVTDISCLGCVHELSIHQNNVITNISVLKNISMLGNVRTLDVTYCGGVTEENLKSINSGINNIKCRQINNGTIIYMS